MQVLKRHKKTVLIVVLLVIILTVSLFIVQNSSKPVPTATPSPAPTEISPTPTSTSITSPLPTLLSTPTPSQTPTYNPAPTPTPSLYPGEVTQYQGQSLTPISVFIEDIVLHPDVAIAGTQHINQSTYSLTVTGLVNNTLEYTYDDVVNNFQSYQQVGTLICVEGWSVTMLWQGVLVSDLLKEAGVSPHATTIIFNASDGYTTELPLDYIVQNNLILAYKINSVTLPAATGFPFMLVAQNQYGYKWIKWITSINVSNDSSYLGTWESAGYPNNATVIDPNNATLHSNNVPVFEAIVVSVAGIVVAAVIYITLVKPKTKKPKILEPPR
ncbi:MAG: molybdopterin-dependent oxidoreductase [Candidatus Bathyarchaeia archaeon]|jgi:DMSO/TMAO reductase YedYZ molybdopterin-dependent catalytic subunit